MDILFRMFSRSFFFPGTFALYAFWAMFLFWMIAEIGARRLAGRHKTGAVKKGDRGSFRIIVLANIAVVGLAFAFRGARIGFLPDWAEWPGLALMLLGVVFRSWAILLLGRFFSVQVELQAGHRVVTAGHYRYIRHPSYTGRLVILGGLGLALGSWVAALVMVFIYGVIYAYRVRVEEAFLLTSLGDEYRAYMGRTGRFIPRLAGLKTRGNRAAI